MHNIFKELLPKSRGESKFVICANVDVRAFSNFSKQVESPESALFIKKAFIKITDNYFSDTSFFKSTGDGLIIVFDVIEEELEELSQKIIDTSIKLVKDFSSLLDDDPMINFDVPDKIGIGLSRGPATCILSDSTVLDYSGDTLNLASRLMDCARPEGVVFDSNFGYELLKPGQKKLFNNKAIYKIGRAHV